MVVSIADGKKRPPELCFHESICTVCYKFSYKTVSDTCTYGIISSFPNNSPAQKNSDHLHTKRIAATKLPSRSSSSGTTESQTLQGSSGDNLNTRLPYKTLGQIANGDTDHSCSAVRIYLLPAGMILFHPFTYNIVYATLWRFVSLETCGGKLSSR